MLALERSMPLPGVEGRIDHMVLDAGRERLDVAALENGSVEVVELSPRGAALVFVDVPSFRGAYQITGSYATKDGATKAKFKLRRGKEAVTDWIEVSGAADALPALIVGAAKKNIPAEKR